MSADAEARDCKRVLLVAYACDPNKGSEPGVGWQFVHAAAETQASVVVVTRQKNVAAIELALQELDIDNCTIVGHDIPSLRRAKKILPLGVQSYYMAWQLSARKVVRKLHLQHDFEVSHHATFGADWLPSAVTALSQVPIVWGPVGGASRTPMNLLFTLGVRGFLGDLLRLFAGELGRARFGRRLADQAALVVAANEDVRSAFRSVEKRIVVEPTVATRGRPGERQCTSPERILATGRLVPWKGWSLAIDALALASNQRLELHFYGQGPDRQRLARLARKRGVASRVFFHSPIPHREILDLFRTSRALVFPSLHDSQPWSVGEALSEGCPTVVLGIGGSKVVAERLGGMTVSPTSSHVAKEIANALDNPTIPTEPTALTADRLPALVANWYAVAAARRPTT